MIAQLRSELLKQRTTRTNVLLLLWMVVLVVLVVLLHVLSFGVDDLSRSDNQLKIVGLGTSIGALFASLLGAMSITGEIRHGTIRPTFLATPRRGRGSDRRSDPDADRGRPRRACARRAAARGVRGARECRRIDRDHTPRCHLKPMPAPDPQRNPMPGLSENDPPPNGSRGGPPVVLVVAVVIVVIILVALHLAGVVGPGSG
jgi:hypothetical protein